VTAQLSITGGQGRKPADRHEEQELTLSGRSIIRFHS
jgi:hypothetical protein